jgi:methionyl-tRNA formyltransferase
MMRIVYAGSPALAIAPLRALRDSGFDVVAVLSQPARPVGRKKVLTDTPVAQVAKEWDIPVFTPRSTGELAQALRETSPDLAIAVAYGRLIDEESLTIPTHGWWNIHFSLLPRWRGATPVQHSILHGDETTGITIFQMDKGLDTGPIVSQVEYQPLPFDTAGVQLHKMAELGASQLIDALNEIDSLELVEQVGEPSHAPKLSRSQGRINWASSSAEIDRVIRAVTPEPGAHTVVSDSGQTIAIIRAFPSPEALELSPGEISVVSGKVHVGTRDGAIVLDRLVPAGKTEMAAVDWCRGAGVGVSFES